MEEDEYYSDDEGVHKPPVDVDMDALAQWCEMIFPRIKDHLNAAVNQRAFDNYEVQWEEERGEIKELHLLYTNFNFMEVNEAVQKTLNLQQQNANESFVNSNNRQENANFDDWDDTTAASKGAAASSSSSQQRASDTTSNLSKITSTVAGLDNNYQVTSISWNCKGSTIAVAYGKMDHTTWCEHQSVVSIYHPFRREFDPFQPAINIDANNCVTEVTFHPTDPLCLAGGTMNGEIYIWDLEKEDHKRYVSEIDEYYHREAITKLLWVRQESLTTMAITTSLISTSTDGKILVWRLSDKLEFPVKGHLLAKKKEGGETAIIGGTALDKVCINEDNTYFVGTEGGQVFKCSISQPNESDISHFFE